MLPGKKYFTYIYGRNCELLVTKLLTCIWSKLSCFLLVRALLPIDWMIWKFDHWPFANPTLLGISETPTASQLTLIIGQLLFIFLYIFLAGLSVLATLCYVAHFVFLRDVQRAAAARRRANNLATHLPYFATHLSHESNNRTANTVGMPPKAWMLA